MTNNLWRPISELREVKEYINESYTYDYYTKHKANDTKDNYTSAYYGYGSKQPFSVHVQENVFLRQLDNSIEYLVADRIKDIDDSIFDLYECDYSQDFDTKFGKFINNNQGEFGGELKTPSGKTIIGNFIYMFEWNNRVFAIDSLSHMICKDFNLIEFTSKDKFRNIYSSHDENDLSDSKEVGVDNLYITNDKVYFVESGVDFSTKENIFRVLSLDKSDKIEEVFSTKDFYTNATSILVHNGNIYLGGNKILIVVDIETKGYKLYTFLSNEDIEDMKKAAMLIKK